MNHQDDVSHPSDHRPYPFCYIYDLRWYHAYQRRTWICTSPSDPPCSTSWTSSGNRGNFPCKTQCKTVIERIQRRISGAGRKERVHLQGPDKRREPVQQDHRPGSSHPCRHGRRDESSRSKRPFPEKMHSNCTILTDSRLISPKRSLRKRVTESTKTASRKQWKSRESKHVLHVK